MEWQPQGGITSSVESKFGGNGHTFVNATDQSVSCLNKPFSINFDFPITRSFNLLRRTDVFCGVWHVMFKNLCQVPIWNSRRHEQAEVANTSKCSCLKADDFYTKTKKRTRRNVMTNPRNFQNTQPLCSHAIFKEHLPSSCHTLTFSDSTYIPQKAGRAPANTIPQILNSTTLLASIYFL
jgi:hypothetical protein